MSKHGVAKYYNKRMDKGDYHIIPFTVTKEEADTQRLYALMNGNYEYIDFVEGDYVKLVWAPKDRKHEIVMSDTPMEIRTNREIIEKANGSVLIGGLGIGMVLMAIQDKPEVESILVIEKSLEVIEMVTSVLPLNDKVTIIHDDVYTYEVPKDVKYDVIYMDVWNDISASNWEKYKKLSRRYAWKINRKNEKRWYGAWRKRDVEKMVRQLEYSYYGR